jgi:hypothetical protein
MDSFNYTFAALRGVQARREYFVAMCPLRLIPKIFLLFQRVKSLADLCKLGAKN